VTDEVRAANKEAEATARWAQGRPQRQDHVRGRLQGDAWNWHLRRSARKRGLIMATMNMIQALNSAMDVMLAATPTCSCSARMSAISAACSAHRRPAEEIRPDALLRHADLRRRHRRRGVGMGAYGLRPVVEIQFADYIYPARPDRVGGRAPALSLGGDFTCPDDVRTPCGGGIFGGQTHSQSPEALFTHVCGLKTVIPSNPYDAKGLLISAIEDDDPVIFLEPKRLYNGPFDGHHDRPSPWSQASGERGAGGLLHVPLGKAAVVREGATSPCWPTAPWCMWRWPRPRERHRRRGDRSAHALCRSISTPSSTRSRRPAAASSCTRPRDQRLRRRAVGLVQEHCFYHLEAPIERVAGWDTPYPHAFEWEWCSIPSSMRLERTCRYSTCQRRPPAP
jgi:2-oxoisovalerate dehydrogenase E1 component beta subunit